MKPESEPIHDTIGVLLAAGESRRMGFNKLRALLAGHPLVWYSQKNLEDSGLARFIAVTGHERDKIGSAFKENVEIVIQPEQRGTGHAAAHAIPLMRDEKYIVLLFGDCPFIDGEVIKQVFQYHVQSEAGITLATSHMKDAKEFGRIVRNDNDTVKRVLDSQESRRNAGESAEIFAGLSIWNADVFKDYIPNIEIKEWEQGKKEQELPDAVESYLLDGGRVATFDKVSEEDALGPNRPEQFKAAAAYLGVKVKQKIINNDVTLTDFDSVSVGFDVHVGGGTEIREKSTLLGDTTIGENCRIGPNTHLENCKVEDGCIIGAGQWENQTFPKQSVIRNAFSSDHKLFRRPSFLIPIDPLSVFVALPFQTPYTERLENIIRPCLTSLGMDCKIASDFHRGTPVMEDVWTEINRSCLIVAEISEPNPNVWYEVGLPHALNKDVILLRDSQTEDKIPFDLQHFRLLMYDSKKGDLQRLLHQWIESAQTMKALPSKPPTQVQD